MKIALAVLVIVLAIGAGFGAGWIAHDATHDTKTVVVQHKRGVDPCQQPLPPADCLGK
jgi:hypothetical protein